MAHDVNSERSIGALISVVDFVDDYFEFVLVDIHGSKDTHRTSLSLGVPQPGLATGDFVPIRAKQDRLDVIPLPIPQPEKQMARAFRGVTYEPTHLYNAPSIGACDVPKFHDFNSFRRFPFQHSHMRDVVRDHLQVALIDTDFPLDP
jgi:hypothetical protein